MLFPGSGGGMSPKLYVGWAISRKDGGTASTGGAWSQDLPVRELWGRHVPRDVEPANSGSLNRHSNRAHFGLLRSTL